MFEKEAEEYGNKYWDCLVDSDDKGMLQEAYKDGAELGYNKANEWHYPSKGEYPDNENDILCQIDKDIVVVGYFHQKNKQYYTISGEWLETVIAWKEIVLPELKESE